VYTDKIEFQKGAIFFDKDLIRKYSDRRKSLNDRDVKDLLRVAINYLKEQVATTDKYSFDIPQVGILHCKYDEELSKMHIRARNNRFYDMFAEQVYKPIKGTPIKKKDSVKNQYSGKTREEIQEFQNTIADEDN
jgi:hypothetical protein